MALMRALGLRPMSYLEYRRMLMDLSMDEPSRLDLKGPSGIESRYFTDDVPAGLVPWVEMGDLLGVPVPTCRIILHLASLVCGRDFAAEGRSLASLGLGHATRDTIRHVVDEALLA